MSRTAELTAKLLDGTLSDGEWAELTALIEGDPVAEAEHLALLELEAELRTLRTDFDLTDATLARIQAAQADQTAGAVLDQIANAPAPAWASKPTEPAPTRSRRRMWVGVAGLVACAAGAFLAVWLSNNPQPIPPGEQQPPLTLEFATLSRMTGSVEVLAPTGEVIRAEEGTKLPGGFTLRTIGDDSLAVVELHHDKTRVEIESDSVVRFSGDSTEKAWTPRLFLASGQLTADVAQRPDDQPLIVGTGVAEVFARGGKFVVSSAGPDSTRVDIKQGKVELVRAATPKPVRLGAGGSAVVFGGQDRLDIENSPYVDRTPVRTFAFPGPRDVAFSPNGEEVWIANARLFTRWPAVGNAKEMSFHPRRGNDGVAAISRNKRYLLSFRGEREDNVLVRTLPDGGEEAAINARLTEPRFWTAAPDASWLAVVDPRPDNKRVRVIDGATSEERFSREFDELITCVAATPDGKNLAVATHTTARGVTNKIVVLDAKTSDRLFALPTLKRPVLAMGFSPDGRYLAVGFNGAIQLWNMQTFEPVRSITGFERALTCVTFSPDGKLLAAGTQDGHVWLWDVETGRQTQLIEIGGRGVRAIAFSPSGKQLVTLANNAPVAVWDVVDRSLVLPKIQ